MKRFLLLTLLVVSLAHAEPWSVNENAPTLNAAPQAKLTVREHLHDYGYRFYKKFLSPADGARCGMYPTCTGFGYLAIKKHGPIVGGWMATDRLMRDNGKSVQFYTLIEKFGRTRIYDPLSENDFWFEKNEK